MQLVRPAGKVHLFHHSNSERLLPLSQFRRPSLRISLKTLQNARNASSELEAEFWPIIQRWSGRLQQLGDMEERSVNPNNRGSKHRVILVSLSSKKDKEDGIRWLLLVMSWRTELIQNGVSKLDVDVTMLMGTLRVGTLGIGGGRVHHARGIGGSKDRVGSAVGSSEDMLFEVCRALYPTNLLHVGRPDVLSTPCGLDGEREEGNSVSENCKGSGECDRCNRINYETYA